jgi:Spy/CpxP family protein refolding chaperone
MKRTLLFAALLFAAMPVAMRAQDPPQAPAQTESTPAPQGRTPDQLVKFYDMKLTLTDDQKAQLKPILADRQQKLQDLRADTSSRPREKMKKMQSIAADADKKINAILTPDQQKKYAEVEAQMKEQAKERRQEKKQGSQN